MLSRCREIFRARYPSSRNFLFIDFDTKSDRVPVIQLIMFRAMMARLVELIDAAVKPPRFFALKDPRYISVAFSSINRPGSA